MQARIVPGSDPGHGVAATETRRRKAHEAVKRAKRRLQQLRREHAVAVRDAKEARAKAKQEREARLTRVRGRLTCPSCGRIGPPRPAVCWYCHEDLAAVEAS